MNYCRIHGQFVAGLFDDGCPKCQEIEKRHERDREEQREAAERDREERRAAEERTQASIEEAASRLEEVAYKQANPGDYECPECNYVTLRRGAKRCPSCRAVMDPDFWPPIFEQEKRDAEERERNRRLAAAEWAKGQPERERQARAAARAAAIKRRAYFFTFLLLLALAGWWVWHHFIYLPIVPHWRIDSFVAQKTPATYARMERLNLGTSKLLIYDRRGEPFYAIILSDCNRREKLQVECMGHDAREEGTAQFVHPVRFFYSPADADAITVTEPDSMTLTLRFTREPAMPRPVPIPLAGH